MPKRLLTTALILAAFGGTRSLKADDTPPTPEAVREAAQHALTLIQASVEEYPKHRDCFSCHHQAIPALTLSLAKERGFQTVDPDLFQALLEHTETDLRLAIEGYRNGEGQGGGATRAGYALWTLESGRWPPDETTQAVVEFLLKRDAGRTHWRSSSSRPPSESSPFTSTYVALRGLKAFATPEQQDAVAARTQTTRDWAVSTPPKETEDHVFRLRTLALAAADPSTVDEAARQLLALQHDDGGWSQLPDQPASDAYATGTALVALHQTGRLPTEHPAYQKGLAYLIKTQHPDGSWHVPSRSKPFQPYFESAFPYANDQFISIAATSWATAALILNVPASMD